MLLSTNKCFLSIRATVEVRFYVAVALVGCDGWVAKEYTKKDRRISLKIHRTTILVCIRIFLRNFKIELNIY